MDEQEHDYADSIDGLMNAIAHADVEPNVYTVNIRKSDYMSGFTATVTFRTYDKTAISGFDAHGDSCDEALQKLYSNLIEKFGKCPHCGSYHHVANVEVK